LLSLGCSVDSLGCSVDSFGYSVDSVGYSVVSFPLFSLLSLVSGVVCCSSFGTCYSSGYVTASSYG